MRDGRRLRGSAKEKNGKDRKEGVSHPGRIKLGAGGIHVTAFIGGNRDTWPHKARKPKEGTAEVKGDFFFFLFHH